MSHATFKIARKTHWKVEKYFADMCLAHRWERVGNWKIIANKRPSSTQHGGSLYLYTTSRNLWHLLWGPTAGHILFPRLISDLLYKLRISQPGCEWHSNCRLIVTKIRYLFLGLPLTWRLLQFQRCWVWQTVPRTWPEFFLLKMKK